MQRNTFYMEPYAHVLCGSLFILVIESLFKKKINQQVNSVNFTNSLIFFVNSVLTENVSP